MAEKFYSWDKYTKEAERDPFILKVPGDEDIVIPAPTGAVLVQVARAGRQQDLEAFFEYLAGEEWPRLKALIDAAPYEAAVNLSADLNEYFGLSDEYELKSPRGERRKVSNPREIRRLLSDGWQVVGER